MTARKITLYNSKPTVIIANKNSQLSHPFGDICKTQQCVLLVNDSTPTYFYCLNINELYYLTNIYVTIIWLTNVHLFYCLFGSYFLTAGNENLIWLKLQIMSKWLCRKKNPPVFHLSTNSTQVSTIYLHVIRYTHIDTHTICEYLKHFSLEITHITNRFKVYIAMPEI